jgi:hypothetical protein
MAMAIDASTVEAMMPNAGTPLFEMRWNRAGKSPSLAASAIAPTVVRAIETSVIGPIPASEVGRLKIPTPMMLPMMSATATGRPKPPPAAAPAPSPAACATAVAGAGRAAPSPADRAAAASGGGCVTASR